MLHHMGTTQFISAEGKYQSIEGEQVPDSPPRPPPPTHTTTTTTTTCALVSRDSSTYKTSDRYVSGSSQQLPPEESSSSANVVSSCTAHTDCTQSPRRKRRGNSTLDKECFNIRTTTCPSCRTTSAGATRAFSCSYNL